ncbi:MAG: hypothetical protein QOK11_389, partial [Pseudonocardiales bacterium]|nr:hypothetical protein [Pseudonocardiales bacterium]
MPTRRLTKPLAIGAAIVVIAGGVYGIAGATSSNSSAGAGAGAGQTAKAGFTARAGSNARSGPAAGGVVGTVSSVPTSSFTVSTSAGQKVTVKKTSSTTYRKGTSSTSARAIKKGKAVLVLGTTNGTTSRRLRSSCNRPAADLQLSRRQRWSPSSAEHRARPSRTARSRRTTARARGRSS